MSVSYKKAIRSEGGQAVEWSFEVEASEILHSLPDAVFTTDRHMRINYFNRAAVSITGFRAAEAIGLFCKDVLKSEICETECLVKRALDSKENIFNIETTITTAENVQIPVLISASLLTGSSEEIVGYMYVFRDISNLKKMMADLKRSRNELSQRNIELDNTLKELQIMQRQLLQAQKMEAVGTLAGGIAHDFNNLLMGMRGTVSLLLMEKGSTHPDYEPLMNIDRQIQSGARLTSQLLGYARKGKYEVTPVNLNRIVEETSEAFGRTRKEISVHRQLSVDLFALEADAGQIEQVLWNLYVNAADAMPSGGELILMTRNASEFDMRGKVYKPQPGRYVLLTVRDTGSGMDKKTMERIYDPFFTTKDMNHGTGLGLASAYGIIKGHGGYIDVCSSPGAGCTFSVFLPASDKRSPGKVVHGKPEIVRGCETVLLVDDEETVRQVSEDLLKAMGYHLLSAADGNEALEVYTRHRQDIAVVLLDMVMPMMGGGEVYDRLKEIDPNVKVLLLSGYSLDGEASEILRRGCNGFIQKPFNIKELSKKIRSIIEA